MATKGVYQGEDTMVAARDQSLWDVMQGKKRHDQRTLDQYGNRQLFSSGSNILEAFLPPGWKQLVDVGSKQLEQKLFPMPEYEEEDGQFWASSEIAELKEQDVARRKGADETFLESIIGAGEDYIGSGGGFDLASLFARKGGRVPKYKNGGLLS